MELLRVIRGSSRLAKVWIGLALLLVVLSGCFGRIDDRVPDRRVNRKLFKLSESKPAVLTFGALWCHPCLAEIDVLNRAQSEFGTQIEFLGLVVEGAAKGETVGTDKLEKFISPEGHKPSYRLELDNGWQAYSDLLPNTGRLLPTLVFIDREGRVAKVLQRSLDYETELRPELQALLGEVATPSPVLSPSPSPEPGEILVRKISQWSELEGATPDSQMFQKVRSGWQKGIQKFNFVESEMPFEHGDMTFVFSKGRPPSPIQSYWVAEESGCKLTVKYFPDGEYKSADGVCSPW